MEQEAQNIQKEPLFLEPTNIQAQKQVKSSSSGLSEQNVQKCNSREILNFKLKKYKFYTDVHTFKDPINPDKGKL